MEAQAEIGGAAGKDASEVFVEFLGIGKSDCIPDFLYPQVGG